MPTNGSLSVPGATRSWALLIEEMGHLALVNNLLVAVGGAPHFDRPNLPVPAGYHPSGFVIRLAPFTRETLEHFVFLERPAQAKVQDPAGRISPPRARTRSNARAI